MIIRSTFVCVCLLCLTAVASPATRPSTEPNAPYAQVVGLELGYKIQDSESRPGINEPGTAVAIYARIDDGSLIQYAVTGTKIDEFSDDHGTNLLDAQEDFPRQVGVGRRAKFSSDGRGALFTIESSRLPARGATALHVRGSIAFSAADNKKPALASKVPADNGATFAVGGVHYVLEDVGKNDSPIAGFSITLKTSDPDDSIADMAFQDDSGKPIDIKYGMSAHMSAGDHQETTRQVIFPAKPDHINVVAQIWQNVHTVAIPLDLHTSIGG